MQQILLRTPRHFETESQLGYCLRLSEANGYSTPSDVFIAAGVTPPEVLQPDGDFTRKICRLVGASDGSLDGITYAGPDGGLRKPVILGNPIHVRYLRLKRPRLCPACVVEDGYIGAQWDMSLMTACPTHGTVLLSVCPGCSQSIRWRRPALLRCGCGKCWSHVELDPAPPQLIELMRYVHRATLGTTEQASERFEQVPSAALAAMNLRQLLGLIENLGKLSAYGNIGLRKVDWDLVVAKASDVLHKWPHGFHELIRKFDSGPRKDSVSFCARFGDLYYGLLRNHFGPHLAFLREEFDNFGHNLDGHALASRRSPRKKDARYVSLQEAGNRLDMNTHTVRQYIKRGMLNAHVVHLKDMDRYVVDVESFQLKVGNRDESLGLKQAALYIGLPQNTFKQLRMAGVYRATFKTKRIHLYHKNDLDEFKQGFMRRIPVGSTGNGSSIQGITIGAVLRNHLIGTKERKVQLFKAILKGEIVPLGVCGESITDIVLPAEQTREYLKAGLADKFKRTASSDCQKNKGLSQKAAAAFLKVPKNVFRQLLMEEHPVVKAFTRGKSIRVEDLLKFESALLGRAGDEVLTDIDRDTQVTLGGLLEHTPFHSASAKPRLILAILDGCIPVMGCIGTTIPCVVLSKKVAKEFVSNLRSEAEGGTRSVREVAEILMCAPQHVRGLVEKGHLKAFETRGRVRIYIDSIQAFLSEYISLTQVAAQIGTSSPKLIHICDDNDIPYLRCRYSRERTSQLFIKREYQSWVERAAHEMNLVHHPDSPLATSITAKGKGRAR